MQSIKTKVEEFSKSNPNCGSFLQNFLKKREEKINKIKDDYKKGKVLEKVREICEYDVANFKKLAYPGFKYKLEMLNINDPDYTLLENSIKNDIILTKGLKVYRVISNEETSTESSDSNQILLLHGTKAQSVEGILKTGFNPSQQGSYGPGVYLTDSSNIAYDYSESFVTEKNSIRKFRYFFVNSVPNPEIQLPYFMCERNTSFKDYLCSKQSIKMFNDSLNEPLKIEECSLDLFDSHDRKVLEGSFQKGDQENIALAHHDLVIPAYLIEIEEKLHVEDLVNGILYSLSKVEGYAESFADSDIIQETNKENNSENKLFDFSFTKIEDEFKKEIDRHYHAKIDCLISALADDTNSIIKQLSFQISSIFVAKDDEKRKFSTELLHKENDDYKFISRSICNKSAEILPKIRELFRINPTNENEVNNLKGKYIYLSGLDAEKVKHVLTNGYSNSQKSPEEFDSVLHRTGTNLNFAKLVGRNFCEVDNTVKMLSFVFVVCSKEKHDDNKGRKTIEDSRKSVTKEGLFSSECFGAVRNRLDLIPAYLIIFEADDK